MKVLLREPRPSTNFQEAARRYGLRGGFSLVALGEAELRRFSEVVRRAVGLPAAVIRPEIYRAIPATTKQTAPTMNVTGSLSSTPTAAANAGTHKSANNLPDSRVFG